MDNIMIAVSVICVIFFLPLIIKAAANIGATITDGIIEFVQYIVDEWKDFLKVVFGSGRG